MANDLTELHERVEYSNGEIDTLNDRTIEFCSEAIQVFAEGSSRFVAFSARLLKPLPVAIRSQAGMIANELRSCLDSLACKLAERNNQTTSGVYFPISKSAEIFADDGMRKIKKLSPVDQQKIVNLRPYRGENDLLWGLHEADRRRKHIRLNAAGVGAAGLDFSDMPGAISGLGGLGGNVYMTDCTVNGRSVPFMNFSQAILEVGKRVEIGHVIGLTEQIGPSFTVAFEEPADLAGYPVTAALRDFSAVVSQVINLFEPEP